MDRSRRSTALGTLTLLQPRGFGPELTCRKIVIDRVVQNHAIRAVSHS